MPTIKTISFKGKVPLVSDQILRTRIVLPVAADAQYDASTGDFLVNRSGSGLSNLRLANSGTFSYAVENGMTVYMNGSPTAVLRSTGDTGSYYTTTFIVSNSTIDFNYNFGVTGSSTTRGQIAVYQAQPNTLNAVTAWGSDPIGAAYQPQKQTPSYTPGSAAYIIAVTSDHGSPWPNISNTMRFNGATCSAPTIGGAYSVDPTATAVSRMAIGGVSKLYEVIHYFRTLTSAEIRLVEAYLSQKWSVSI